MSDKPVEKHADKPVVVMHRMEPIAGRFQDAKKVSEDWLEFMKKIDGFKGSDVICCMENQIAWVEEWESRAAVEKFNEEHFAFADFLGNMLSCSRKVPTRFMYRRIS